MWSPRKAYGTQAPCTHHVHATTTYTVHVLSAELWAADTKGRTLVCVPITLMCERPWRFGCWTGSARDLPHSRLVVGYDSSKRMQALCCWKHHFSFDV